jgi:signal transduction histidine kinase
MIQKPSLKRAAQVAVFNTLIALGISGFTDYGLWMNWVYSQCIGLSIWALVDFGQYWLIKDINLQWRRLFIIVPLSATLGYLLGTTLAQLLFPVHNFNFWIEQPRRALGFLIISLLAGGISTYFFMSREQLAIAQRQAAEAQLKLLQTQLEPHMLFNTLANLRALITIDPVQAQAMLDHMVAYLRATLSSSRATMHPLQAEFDRLRDYLELMSVRMGPRLHFNLQLPAELANISVPPLLLQPLVENAIKHGLEPKVQGGLITVRASRAHKLITLEVHDSGVGLPGQGQAEGFGLMQVRERLETVYGKLGTIEFIAGDACGACARVTFPC